MKTKPIIIPSILALAAIVSALLACTPSSNESALVAGRDYDPLAYARSTTGQIVNFEAAVPSMCYTKTDGVSNPCWTCHTDGRFTNHHFDWTLQEEYAFSDAALENHWDNLFIDHSSETASISDQEALSYIRQDNYKPLVQALAAREDFAGWKPDLSFELGFEEDGFARDGSYWRALRYKPFLGTFWPTNGNTDDVFIRLPSKFRTDANGTFSKEIYKANLSLLETLIAAGSEFGIPESDQVRRKVEPIDESVIGYDLDQNGSLGIAAEIVGLPATYFGAAADHPARRYVYPDGTEFMHTVRYVDPDRPTLLSTRMKEVRYMVKRLELDDWGIQTRFAHEHEHKALGRLPVYRGSAEVGLRSEY
ncbi:MAG: hypothetical protein KDB07_12260, partial [Planctomycetes bacterium]|nr:hypothetical protein [Planctomycetota bacterium]